MSRKGGGSGNPFARTVQTTGPPNQNQRQPQQTQQFNASRGQQQPQGGRNPFAQQGAMQQQQPHQLQPLFNQQTAQQHRNQPLQKQQQVNARPSAVGNPFAQSSGGFSRGSDSSTMEMDSSFDSRGSNAPSQFQQQRGGQPPRGPFNPFGQKSHQNQQQPMQQLVSRNPFAASASSGINAPAAAANAGRNPFTMSAQQQQQQQQQSFPQMQQHMHGQLQQHAAGFGAHSGSHIDHQNQQQQHHSAPFNQQGGFYPASSSSGQAPNMFAPRGAAPALLGPPPKAIVNAATLSAVNVSAALGPAKVEDIDLGLGLGSPPPSAPAAVPASTVPPRPPVQATATGGEQSSAVINTSAEDKLQLDMQALITEILATSPAVAFSALAPAEGPYALMAVAGKLDLVACRIPAVPPARQKQQHHHQQQQQQQQHQHAQRPVMGGGLGFGGGNNGGGASSSSGSINPFFSGGGGGASLFGKAQ